MYRILTASKDTYVTNKYIAGSRSLNSNVGQAGSNDLYHLKDEIFLSASVSGTIELSRILIQFDYNPLIALTSSILNVANSSFKCYLQLKDIYGGQTTPSNFTLRTIPLSRSWDEGRGLDVVAYRDIDAANFLTASISNGSPSLWFASGSGASGSMGATDIDIITSGNIGSGVQDLTVTQSFARGDEHLWMDVTHLVSASIVGILPNNGFRISFIDQEEYDGVTRFVKRFGSRHTNNKDLRPKIIVKYNDTINDANNNALFNVSQSFYTYNIVNGSYANFTSGSSQITGSNSAILRLIASRSITWATNSYSISHSASISYLTRSLYIITQSFSASQFALNNISQTGIYSSSVNLSTVTNQALINFLSGSSEQSFRSEWVSLDGSVVYSKGHILFKQPYGSFSNVLERNYVVNITNLKQVYTSDEVVRLRVFVQDNNTETRAFRFASDTNSVILNNMKWRLRKAYSRDIVIPFDNPATLCSSDFGGMYFDIFMQDLDLNEIYELEFSITESNRDYFVSNEGFRFKVSS